MTCTISDTVVFIAAYRHCLPAGALPSAAHSYGFYLVTAAVDRMDMLRPLEDPITGVVPDLRLSGHVSFTTDSSLEVFVRLSTIPSLESEKEPVTILLGRFAMAARKVGGGKYFIPKLLVEGPEEEELYRDGEKSKETKLERSKTSLEKVSPNEKEAALMHGLFVGRGAMFGELSRFMSLFLLLLITALSPSNREKCSNSGRRGLDV